MKSSIFNSTIVVVLSIAWPISVVDGRHWRTIIDHNIEIKSNIDGRRYQLTIEADPFFFPQDKNDEDGITEAPQADAWVTLSPTPAPSSMPSDGPSLAPTVWDIDMNGGCRLGHDLYEVHMYDSWGDGWDQTIIKIIGIEDQDPIDLPTNAMTRTVTDQQGDVTVSISRTIDLDTQNAFRPEQETEVDPLGVIFQGGLRRGSHDYGDVCLLPKRCYEVRISGGEFLDEVSWDIRPADLQNPGQSNSKRPILAGGAPSWCTFSLPDEYGHHFCANTCSSDLTESAMTEAPNVLGTLQFNNGAFGMGVINHDVGEEYSQTIGTTGSSVLDGVFSRNDGSTVLSKFKRVQDEGSNN